MEFRRGQRVEVVGAAGHPECAEFVGQVGTVFRDGPNHLNQVAVAGLTAKSGRRVRGSVPFLPGDLKKS